MSPETPAISELAIESSALTLFNEFLKGYFDGSIHAVGSNASATFPSAVLLYQQAANPQPLNGISIQQVMLHSGEPYKCWEQSALANGSRHAIRIAIVNARFLFLVRCTGPATTDGNSTRRVMLAAELLYGLLNNSMATRPLSEHGILHLCPAPPEIVANGSGALPNPDNDYAMRAVYCRAQLRYPIESQSYNKAVHPAPMTSDATVPEPHIIRGSFGV